MSQLEILRLSFPDLGALEREIANNIRFGRIFIGEVLQAPVLSEGVLVIVHPVDGRELRLQAQIVMVNSDGPMRGTGLALRSFGPPEVEQVEAFARDRGGDGKGAVTIGSPRPARPVDAGRPSRPIAPPVSDAELQAALQAPTVRPAASEEPELRREILQPSAAEEDWSDLAEPEQARPRVATPTRVRIATPSGARQPIGVREEIVANVRPREPKSAPLRAASTTMPKVIPREEDARPKVTSDRAPVPTAKPPPPTAASSTIPKVVMRDDDDWSGVASDEEPEPAPTPMPQPTAAAVQAAETVIPARGDDDDWSGVAPDEESDPTAAPQAVAEAAAPATTPPQRDDDDWSGVAPEDATEAAPEPVASAPPAPARDDDDWSEVAAAVAADGEPEEAQAAASGDQVEAHPDEEPHADGEEMFDEEHIPDDPATRSHDLQSGNRQERLRSLNVIEQLKIARKGELSDRVVIERLYGKTVWEALLQNPRITLPEVARIARKGTVPRPLLEVILENATWLKAASVRRGLLGNPKLTSESVQKLLRLTPKHELKVLEKGTAYPMAVRDAARKILRE